MKVTAEVGASAGDIAAKVDRLATKWTKAADDALVGAVGEAAEAIEGKGRADIGQAGNFGGRWIEGFKATVSGGGGGEVDLTVTEDVAYWPVFQFGATIVGRPLLYFKPTKAIGGLEGKPLPLLISKHSVSIPKKFHLIEISTAEAETVPLLFGQRLKAAKGSITKD